MSTELKETINKVLSDERDVRSATTEYQHEFPYEQDDEAQVTRREFCGFLFLTSTTLLAGTAGYAAKSYYDVRNIESFAPMEIEGARQLTPGSSLNFKYPGENDTAILIRARNGEYFAYDQKCTHLTCPVYYSKEHSRLECPCHEGGFDLATGAVLYGPPPRPLDRVEIEKRPDGSVWAVGRTKAGGHGEL